MRSDDFVFGHLHSLRADVNGQPEIVARSDFAISNPQLRPDKEFTKEIVIWNDDGYSEIHGLLTITSLGDIWVYRDITKIEGFSINGKAGWKDLTFAYLGSNV